MRSVGEAARIINGRMDAALSNEGGYVPDMLARQVLGSLVPLEEIDGLVHSIHGSAHSLMDYCDRNEVLREDLERVQTQSLFGRFFTQVVCEIGFALLMAGVDQAPATLPAAPEICGCGVRFVNGDTGACARCHKPMHGGRP